MTVSIKISEENYKELCSLSGKLREESGKPASINDAISFLRKKKRLSELAGSWKMSDKEVGDFNNRLNKGWKRWQIKSV